MSGGSGRPHRGNMEVAIRLAAVNQFEGSQAVGVAGVLESVGDEMQQTFQPGDEVMACTRRASTTTLTPGATIVLGGKLVCAKPPRISIEAAARVAQTLGVCAVIIAKCFPEERAGDSDLKEPAKSSEPHGAQTATVPTVLVTGGETLAGAVLAYLLKRKVENAQVYATCSGRDDEELHHLCGRLVEHARAIYAIDADAPDLFKHLQASSQVYNGAQGMEVIVDLVGLVARQAKLMELSVGRAVFVNGETADTEEDFVRLLDQDDGMMATLGRLLHDMPATHGRIITPFVAGIRADQWRTIAQYKDQGVSSPASHVVSSLHR